jgi:hypothetical protein
MIKNILAISSLCLAFMGAYAQDCTTSLYLQKGKTIEMTIYDKKGEPNGREVYQISDVSSGGGTTTGTLNSEMFDKNGNSKAKVNSSITCTGGEIHLDMKLFLPPQQNEQVAGKMQANAKTSFLNYPNDMKVGDNLPDGNFSIDLSNGNTPPGGPGGPPGPPPPPFGSRSLTMVINARHVESQESVTTTAGTWNCFRISFKSKIRVQTGPLGFPVTVEGTEWYAPGVGIVKSQTKNGGTAITSIK